MRSTNYGFILPPKGTIDWDTPLNTNFESIDKEMKKIEDKADAIKGIEVDTTGLSDGDTLIYDATRNVFKVGKL